MFLFMLRFSLLDSNVICCCCGPIKVSSCRMSNGWLPGCCSVFLHSILTAFFIKFFFKSVGYFSSVFLRFSFLLLSAQEQSPSNATSLAMMQEPQEVVEETVTIEEDPGTPTSHVSVVTSDDGTTRRTETKVRRKAAHTAWSQCIGSGWCWS